MIRTELLFRKIYKFNFLKGLFLAYGPSLSFDIGLQLAEKLQIHKIHGTANFSICCEFVRLV